MFQIILLYLEFEKMQIKIECEYIVYAILSQCSYLAAYNTLIFFILFSILLLKTMNAATKHCIICGTNFFDGFVH
jgi:hypothetical protein